MKKISPPLLLALFIMVTSANAEVVSGSDIPEGGGPTVSRPGTSMLDLLNTVAKPQQLVLPGNCFENGITKDEGQIEQYICQMRDTSSSSLISTPFCSSWPALEKKIAAISSATGYPSAVMECTYLIESKFKPGLTSPAGAKGLSQFMPDTARTLASSIKDNPDLKGMWDKFTASACAGADKSSCQKPPPTKEDILGTTGDVDAQLMATPLFYRKFYAAYEKDWADLISSDKTKITDYYHFLVIGYNAGPKVAEKFLRNVKNGVKPPDGAMPAETKKYEKQLDDCMLDSGSGVAQKGGTRQDCQGLRKGQKCG